MKRMRKPLKAIRRCRGARNVHEFLTVDRLEPRTLLASLINVGDAIISPSNDKAEVAWIELKRDEGLCPEVQDRHGADRHGADRHGADRHEREGTCQINDGQHRDGENGKDCQDFEFKTDTIDAPALQLPDASVWPQVPIAPSKNFGSNRLFIAPAVTPLNAKQSSVPRVPLPVSPVQPPVATDPSAFRYFVGQYETDRDENVSLALKPLAEVAVKETFFAQLLLDHTTVVQREVSGFKPERAFVGSSTNVPQVAAAPHETSRFNEADMVSVSPQQNAEDNIARAEETLRHVDTMFASTFLEFDDTNVADVVIERVVDISINPAIPSKQASANSGRNRLAFLSHGWQIGLFGMISAFITVRVFPSKKEDDSPFKPNEAVKECDSNE